jgi:DNA-binding NarL/FixJ family response regulator
MHFRELRKFHSRELQTPNNRFVAPTLEETGNLSKGTESERKFKAKKKLMARKARQAVLVIDSHPIWQRGIASSISSQSDLRICGHISSLSHAVESIRRLRPDVVILDIGQGPAQGIELIKSIALHFPDSAVLVVSLNDEALYAERAIRAGAKGYLMKQEPADVLVTAIRQVLRGGVYLSSRMREILLNKALSNDRSNGEADLSSLSDRELEVFMMLGSGKLNREIAKRMKVSVKTIDAYRAHIKQKLHLKNAMQLIRFAVLHTQPGLHGSRI